jgi:tRNA dimethylallyltransferase
MNIYILFGQTATGKTAKALELCTQHNGEIVNFDSRQIYKKLDIITGKDIPSGSLFHVQSSSANKSIGFYELRTTNYELRTPQARIWLYDIIDPKQPFSSAEYVECAMEVIRDIISRGKTPILVGGTGYYLRHLLYGAPEMKVAENWDLRDKLEQKTVEELQTILKDKNIDMFTNLNNSDRSNPRRLIRRIELAQSGLQSLPTQPTQETLTSRVSALKSITYLPFFHFSREALESKIISRVNNRIESGAIEEVKELLKEGYEIADPGLNAIGYQQIAGYLRNEITLDEAKKQWNTKEIQYAKRQKTFFKKLFPHLFKE